MYTGKWGVMYGLCAGQKKKKNLGPAVDIVAFLIKGRISQISFNF